MKHIAKITKAPRRSGRESVPDGAINGNGDLAVVLGNSGRGMKIYLAKSDLWYGCESWCDGGIKPLGSIDIDIPDKLYENYYAEQNADEGKIFCRFESGKEKLEISIMVCRTENTVIIDIDGNIPLPAPVLQPVSGDYKGRAGKDDKGFIYRIFDGEECSYKTEAYAGIVKTGEKQYCLYAVTNHDTDNPYGNICSYIEALDGGKVNELRAAHSAAWKEFWAKSSMKLSDERLENGWYQSVYLLACSAGNREFPPGLFGNFITVEYPAWRGDYHLNYNYQAPFYAACNSNHPELTDCYHAPLEEFMDRGREFAEKFGCKGIIYPVGIAPKGMVTEYNPNTKYPFLRMFLGQKNNQIHPADIMIFRWRATRDIDYARDHAYPYLKECLQFFEDYMIFENGRYSILKDAAHEVPYYRDDFTEEKYKKTVNDKNSVLTLGLLRMGLDAGIDMAKALGVDEDKQKKWQEMLDKLSPFPTFIKKGRKVYRYTEKGEAWNSTNSVGLQHIYPSGCIDLGSDDKALKIARNSLTVTKRWLDFNATNSIYPAAVRIGINPVTIMKYFNRNIDAHLMENHMFDYGGGGMENCSVIPNTINEMAVMSNGYVLRFFAVWDKRIDCEFRNLRADGAFLVSGSIKQGITGDITIYSEKGSLLTYIDPFTGEKKSRETKPGETIILSRNN